MNPDREEQLKRAAHDIWEREGRPEGADIDHWRRAEEELGPDIDNGESGADGFEGDDLANPRAMREAAREHSDTYLVATDLEDDDQRTLSAGTREQP
jgi:Protein of unknown function (DUF2934)